MAEVIHPDLPAGGPLLLRSLTRLAAAPQRVAGLPRSSATVLGHTQDVERLAAYDQVCGFTLRDTVPATWLHVLSFSLQLAVMSGRDFPFGLAGLVHVSNQMSLLRPVSVAQRLDLTVYPGELSAHPRGALFELVGEARVGGDLVWRGVSRYLARGVQTPGEAIRTPRLPVPAAPASQSWRLPAGLGRRYAAVSGDANPIHVSNLAAKAFGFPRAIIHGMWTHARALAALEGLLPPTYQVAVDFTKPILLPSRVGFAAAADAGATAFAVLGKQDKPHLIGRVEPLAP